MQTKRKLLIVSLFYLLLVAPFFACRSKESQQMIEQTFLQDDLKVGQIIRLSSIIGSTSGTMCVLYPYQPFVAADLAESVRINAHLKAVGYAPDESHWAIVIAEPNAVHLSKFKRSKKMDLLASHEITPEQKAKFARRFESTICSSIDKAAVTKFESLGRIFVVMGEIK